MLLDEFPLGTVNPWAIPWANSWANLAICITDPENSMAHSLPIAFVTSPPRCSIDEPMDDDDA